MNVCVCVCVHIFYFTYSVLYIVVVLYGKILCIVSFDDTCNRKKKYETATKKKHVQCECDFVRQPFDPLCHTYMVMGNRWETISRC